jgi:hypothetical protein
MNATEAMGRTLSVEEEREFVAELFAIIVRYDETINIARLVDQELTEK